MTEFEDPETYDDGYYDSLIKSDKERFRDDFKQNLDDFDADEIRRSIKSEYHESGEHLKLVKAVSACFHPKQGAATDSGFVFHGVNPLYGTNPSPADAIIINSEHNCVYVLLVFCEIGGEDRGEWVENVNDAHVFFDKKNTKDFLRDRLNIAKRDLEIGYVTLAREDDTVEMDFAILNKKCNPNTFAIWECDTDDRWIRHVAGQFLHPDLEHEFDSDVDYSKRKEPINFAVGTHLVFPLERLVYQIIKTNQTFHEENIDEFDRDTFYDNYSDELKVFCRKDYEDQVINSEVNRVLDIGENTRILTSDSSEIEDGEYKVVYSGARGPDHAKDAVEGRYIKYKPKYEVGRKSFEKTKDEFDESTSLGDFIK